MPLVDIYHSDDPDNPGAGVETVEVAPEPGGQGEVAVTSGGGESSGGGGNSGGGGGTSAPAQDCQVYETPSVAASIADALGASEDRQVNGQTVQGGMAPGTEYYRECHYADDDRLASLDAFTYSPSAPADPGTPAAPPAPPDASVIARQVYSEVPLVAPTPHTSPAPDVPQLVGLPVWLWVDDAVWRPFEASASLGGVTVTVSAQPASLTWNMGDGTRLTCEGPGTPWTPAKTGTTSDCSHVYQFTSADQPNGRYATRVTVSWSVSWSASTGETGTLPDASRSTPFSLNVRQRQAVISYGN